MKSEEKITEKKEQKEREGKKKERGKEKKDKRKKLEREKQRKLRMFLVARMFSWQPDFNLSVQHKPIALSHSYIIQLSPNQ